MNGGNNAGIIVAHPSNTNGIDFVSSGDATLANRPRLNITYAPQDTTERALDFDGTNDYVTMGAAPALGLAQFTLEAWIKRTGTGQSTGSGAGGVTMIPLIAKGRGESDGSTVDCSYFFGLRATDGVLAADFEDMATGGNHPVIGTTPVTSNVWHHVAASYDGTSSRRRLDALWFRARGAADGGARRRSSGDRRLLAHGDPRERRRLTACASCAPRAQPRPFKDACMKMLARDDVPSPAELAVKQALLGPLKHLVYDFISDGARFRPLTFRFR